MAKPGKSVGIGYRRPPAKSRFKPGKSGNPKGRPTGVKNFATAIAEELDHRVPVTENGRRRKISKRQVIAKQVINKAASGDLKAAQTIFTQDRLNEDAVPADGAASALDGPHRPLVMAEIVRRIRLMDEVPASRPKNKRATNSPAILPGIQLKEKE